MSTLYGVTLLVKGETKKTKLKDIKDKNPLSLETVQGILKKKTPVEELGTYVYNSLQLTLFGYKTGKAGTENKHDLPAPLNESEYFGDILIIAWREGSSWTTPVNFTPDDYEKFFQNSFGGGDDEDDEDDEDEEDEEKEEDEEEEEVVAVASKKKAAEEDGVPEDEEEEEEEDDEEEEEEEEEEALVEGEDCEEEPVVPTRATKTASKKKVSKTTAASQQTGRARQLQLIKKIGYQDFETVRPIPAANGHERTCRQHGLSVLTKFLGKHLPADKIPQLETTVLHVALQDANTKQVMRNFENPLFRDIYMFVLRRIVSNLDPNGYVENKNLLSKILSNDLTIETLTTMNVMDYSPQLYAGLRERMLLREKQQLEGNKAMATDMFKCGRCHKRETTFYELQTRSADEPMTKFITCVNCGNHWRQ